MNNRIQIDLAEILPPACQHGYTREQVEQIVAERFDEFATWSRGMTAAICDGRRYDHEAKEYQPTGCGPHGVVVYPWDIAQFIKGRDPLD